jgi:hypothetical protein
MTFSDSFSPYIEEGELAAVGYGGLACRRSTQRFVASRRWPRRLTSEPVGAHGRHLNRRGPRRMDAKSAKFSNRRIFLQNNFKKIYKKFQCFGEKSPDDN